MYHIPLAVLTVCGSLGGLALLGGVCFEIATAGLALAQAPPAPPPGLADATGYVAYDALWPTEDGVETVTLYVVRHPLCGSDPPAERFGCRAADLDGDGVVGVPDLGRCSEIKDELTAKACGEVVRVFWGASCAAR